MKRAGTSAFTERRNAWIGATSEASNPCAHRSAANSVRQALVDGGVSGAIVIGKGYGDSRPVASNDTEYGRFRNRRIEYAALPSSTTR